MIVIGDRSWADLNDEQLRRWVDGDPQHIGDRKDPTSQCCPDFSCCRPELLAPPDVRRAFVAAGPNGRGAFLGGFLGAMIAAAQVSGDIDPEKKIAIATGEVPQ